MRACRHLIASSVALTRSQGQTIASAAAAPAPVVAVVVVVVAAVVVPAPQLEAQPMTSFSEGAMPRSASRFRFAWPGVLYTFALFNSAATLVTGFGLLGLANSSYQVASSLGQVTFFPKQGTVPSETYASP